jgi:predicted XRE-type DNA-binding protein
MNRRIVSSEEIPMPSMTRGSGNIFRDLGLPDSSNLEIKAELVLRISRIIERRRLTQMQAAKILGIDQPKVSMLLRGRYEGFSIERILRFLTALDQDVKITIAPKRRGVAEVRVA